MIFEILVTGGTGSFNICAFSARAFSVVIHLKRTPYEKVIVVLLNTNHKTCRQYRRIHWEVHPCVEGSPITPFHSKYTQKYHDNNHHQKYSISFTEVHMVAERSTIFFKIYMDKSRRHLSNAKESLDSEVGWIVK